MIRKAYFLYTKGMRTSKFLPHLIISVILSVFVFVFGNGLLIIMPVCIMTTALLLALEKRFGTTAAIVAGLSAAGVVGWIVFAG